MNSGSTVSLMLRMVFSLGVVVTLMVLCARVMRKRGMAGMRKAAKTMDITVLARRGLGKHASVAVIETGGRQLIIGVTDQRVTLLGEADEDLALDLELEELTSEHHGTVAPRDALPAAKPALALSSSSARKGLLDSLRDITVRRV
jgi:flagellar protein FliO/FliZ